MYKIKKKASEFEPTPDTPILAEEGAEEYDTSITPSTEHESLGDWMQSSSSSTPEERLLNLIRGSEEIAKRLGLGYVEAEMTAEELEDRLRKVLNLQGLSDKEMDSVLTLAANLVASPAAMLGGTPRVKITDEPKTHIAFSRIKTLVKLANDLDSKGLRKEADTLDSIILDLKG